MKKSHNLLVSSVFVLFLASVAVCSLALPDRSFSEMENRNLRPVPELTARRFASGRYMTEAEEYVSDQLVLRDGWVALKALGERLTGKQENNGIYFASGDTLIRRIEEPDQVILEVKFDDFLPGHLAAALADIPKAPMAISKFAMCLNLF